MPFFCSPAYTWPLLGRLDRHGHFVFANRKNFHLIISHENHFLPHFVAHLPWLHCLVRSPIPNQSRQGPGVATKDPDFAIQGEYAATSEIGHKGKKGQYGLQVVALGDGNFQAALYKGGLPGSGAENNEFVLLTGSTEAGKTTLKAKSGETVIIKGDTATGTKGDKKLFAYDRVERKSPTLGKKAPKGAKVLFPGVEMDRFSGGIKLDGDLLEEGVVSLDSFGDFSLHLEFRTPYKPSTKPGNQDRGNSGVYIFNNYETQILDSFGIKGEFNFCGALYRKKAPDLNMCLPPLAWQTYDIEFTAPFKDAKDPKVRITIRHNGVVIHDDYELDKGTEQAEVARKRKKGRSTCGSQPRPIPEHLVGRKVKAIRGTPDPKPIPGIPSWVIQSAHSPNQLSSQRKADHLDANFAPVPESIDLNGRHLIADRYPIC